MGILNQLHLIMPLQSFNQHTNTLQASHTTFTYHYLMKLITVVAFSKTTSCKEP